MKYFKNIIEYPGNIALGLPNNTLWCYVSNTYLNGYINYVTPIKSYLLNRYCDWNDKFDSGFNVSVFNEEKHKYIKKHLCTKNEIYNFLIKSKPSEYSLVHTKISQLKDDVIILAHGYNDKNEQNNYYLLFWFDHNVSDCCIGKFYTEDKLENVIKEFNNYVVYSCKESSNLDDCSYKEIPNSFYKGWISF